MYREKVRECVGEKEGGDNCCIPPKNSTLEKVELVAKEPRCSYWPPKDYKTLRDWQSKPKMRMGEAIALIAAVRFNERRNE